MQISFNLLKLRDLCDCCCFQLQTGPKSKTYLLVYIIHRNNWIKHTTLKTCWSSHIICLINVLLLFLQVECNTKLDPTKATLLKVRAPLIPSVVAFTPHLLSHPDYNHLDDNSSADKIPLAQHLPGDILTSGMTAERFPRAHWPTSAGLWRAFYEPHLKSNGCLT